MALHRFAHLGVETKNIFEIMLNRPLADGIQMDFHFVKSAPVIQQVLLFPEQQAGQSGQHGQQTFKNKNDGQSQFFCVVFFQDSRLRSENQSLVSQRDKLVTLELHSRDDLARCVTAF